LLVSVLSLTEEMSKLCCNGRDNVAVAADVFTLRNNVATITRRQFLPSPHQHHLFSLLSLTTMPMRSGAMTSRHVTVTSLTGGGHGTPTDRPNAH